MANEKLKKTIFQLKLDGTYDSIIRHAYMMGYVQGHKFGKTMGNIIPSDLEKAFDEYEKEYQSVLYADEEGQKPT